MGIERTWLLSAVLPALVVLVLAARADAWETGTDRPGSTFQTLPLSEPADEGIERCAALCRNEERCLSWTYVRPGNPDRGASEFGLCLLKDAIPEAAADACCASGVKGGEESAPARDDTAKPVGSPAWVGLQIQNVTDAVAQQTGAAAGSGVYVVKVSEGGPAERAGIRQGDIITEFDGVALSGVAELVRAVAARLPGDRVNVAVVRGGVSLRLTIEIGARPAE